MSAEFDSRSTTQSSLKAEGDGWDIDVIRELQTASERYMWTSVN